MEDMEGNEGMSTGKKVAAGAALGVAVPAAVAVGKKLLGNGDDDGDKSQESGGTSRRSPGQRSRSGSSSSNRSRARSSSSGTKSRSGGTAKRSSSSRSRSGSSSSGSRGSGSSSSGSSRTKEQLYNQAKRLKIDGRSSMTKAQLERAISRKR